MDRLWRIGLRLAYRLLRVYWFVARPTERGVYAAVWCGGRVLLVRNSYKPGVTFPSGGVRPGEPLAAAAARELREEAGVDVAPRALRLVGEFTSRAEHKTDRSCVFEVELEDEPPVVVDGREVVDGGFVEGAAAAASPGLVPVVEQYFDHLWERAGGAEGEAGARE